MIKKAVPMKLPNVSLKKLSTSKMLLDKIMVAINEL